ncbi:hypothetical protein KPZU09_19160 [Klebsiella pneumoniae]|uniref:Uncharacterized protein n=1 Tax=Klebsiella pneumoniae TaxID=573 RepID=A0A919LU07_KLEPN|nr:hypothetical protein KPZU09_19160 [Klebsiella pneumoniae]
MSQRPEWGPQLSVLLCVCPQRHAQSDALTSALLALRWQLSQLRQQTGMPYRWRCRGRWAAR